MLRTVACGWGEMQRRNFMRDQIERRLRTLWYVNAQFGGFLGEVSIQLFLGSVQAQDHHAIGIIVSERVGARRSRLLHVGSRALPSGSHLPVVDQQERERTRMQGAYRRIEVVRRSVLWGR